MGRRKEFAGFHWKGEVPDPQSIDAFEKSKINWQKRYSGDGKKIASYYQTLIKLKHLPIFHSEADRQIKQISTDQKLLIIHKQSGDSQGVIIANFSNQQRAYTFSFGGGIFTKVLDSADVAWAGPGSSLPYKAVKGDNHVIQAFNVGVFLQSNVKESQEIG